MILDLSKAKEMQTLKGWGTSACWWSQACADEETQKKVISLLYSKSGLGLNIYRYNIGGGYDEENCRIHNPWRRCESFMLFNKETAETSWDFSRDKTAVEVMRNSLDTGNIDTLILFCNSPHYSQTSTGQTSGSLLEHTCNIPKMNYQKFVEYVLDVTQHFLDQGFPVDYISPINEPQWKWGGDVVWQEGCHYECEEIMEIYRLFAKEILRRKMPVKLYAPESGEMLGETLKYFDAMLHDEMIMSVTDVFAYHSYHADNSPETRYEFKEKLSGKYPNLRFDMSEWCELPNMSHTKNFKGALITARIIGQDIIYGGAESWTSWVAVNQFAFKEDGYDYSDALLSANDDFSEWTINERYYALAHYSKYIPVGSVALDLGFRPTENHNDFNVFAFRTPQQETVVVVVNEGEETTVIPTGEFETVEIIKSDSDEKLKPIPYNDAENSITIAPNSVYTLLLK